MSWILIAVILLVIAVVILAKLAQMGRAKDVDYPYQSAGALFSPAERSFYGVLNQAVGKDAKIFGKVRVADVAVPRKGLSRSDWQKAFNKISGKHFDFLLCNNDDLSVICAIELNDSSHESKKRQKRDEFLNGVCIAAQIPLIQIPAKASCAINEIKELLAPHLNIAESSSIAFHKFCPIFWQVNFYIGGYIYATIARGSVLLITVSINRSYASRAFF